MRKITILVALFALVSLFIGCAHSELGSVQTDKRVIALEKEIRLQQEKLEDMAGLPDSVATRDMAEQIKKISDLEKQREKIVWDFATSEKVPKELSDCEVDRRINANYARRQELVLSKVENSVAFADQTSVGGVNQKSGYKVIFANDYSLPITFRLTPLDGGEKTAVNVAARDIVRKNILPGKYHVAGFNGGTQIGEAKEMNIDGSIYDYQGEECFNFVNMPRR